MNKVQLMGRLTKDVEIKETASGHKLARFVLACRQGKDKEGNEITNFIPCSAWERKAEVIAQFYKKGHRMLVTNGELIVANYMDNESQEKRSFTFVRVNDFEFIETRRETEELENKKAAPEKSSFESMGVDIFDDIDF